jgi:alkanesulfonate monooxygenase SsuD/methylene tetrahydromethanopterin reductase-like flavin-dependent oxidoreductase (luciferase family)
MPPVSGRVTTLFDVTEPPVGVSWAAMGSPEQIAEGMRAYAAAGVGHIALVLRETDPSRYVAKAERFMREVAPLVG